MLKLMPFLIVFIVLTSLGFNPASVMAHGVEIDYHETRSIEITARYDNGDPLQGGNISIFSPINPQSPWEEGITDNEGKYLFVPDPSIRGDWTVRVRQAGHGVTTNISIDERSIASGTTGLSPLQIIIMLGCIIWGTVGTSLYFKGRNRHAHS